MMQSNLKKIIKMANEYQIKELNIVTISNNERVNENSLKVNILPFYEWALT